MCHETKHKIKIKIKTNLKKIKNATILWYNGNVIKGDHRLAQLSVMVTLATVFQYRVTRQVIVQSFIHVVQQKIDQMVFVPMTVIIYHHLLSNQHHY